MSINKVILSGNLTRDPELRTTQSGVTVMALSLAVNNRRKNPSTGAWEDDPCYIECFTTGSRAEALAKKLSRGQKVAIEGTLKWRQWDKGGEKRSKHEIRIDTLDFISTQGSKQGDKPQAAPARAEESYDDLLDSDIDF